MDVCPRGFEPHSWYKYTFGRIFLKPHASIGRQFPMYGIFSTSIVWLRWIIQKYKYDHRPICTKFINDRFCGVVVITSALHAEGREFEPRQNLINYFFQVFCYCYNAPVIAYLKYAQLAHDSGRSVLWLSGYHVCFTRRRSRVRTSPEPDQLF